MLLGAGVAISSPAEFALVPAAAGEDRVAEANGHVEAARYLGATAGPLLGGVLAAAGHTRIGLLLNAASFLAVAAAGVALHARRDPAPVTSGAAKERGGLRIAFADRTLAIAMTAAIASLLFFTMSVAAEVFFVTDVLHAGPAVFGLLMTAWTLGMVGGRDRARAARAAVRGSRPARSPASPLQGAGLLGAALGATMATALVAFLVGGVAHGAKNVLLRTLIHERVPEERRGRAFASYNALRNGAELGALGAGGVLVGLAGAQVALALSGAIPLAIGLAAFALLAASRPHTDHHDGKDRVCPRSRLTATLPRRSTSSPPSTTG